jgi:hypothetical protein
MKLKIMLLLAVFAGGVYASIALADEGKKSKRSDAGNCQEVHISGTVAPQTLAVAVDKASSKSLIAAGTTLNLAVGATGQTVRIKAEACATGTGTALVLTVKQLELRPQRVGVQTTTNGTLTSTTTTKKGDDGDDHQGEHKGKGHDKGKTTTVGTTTTAPATTTAATTAAPATTAPATTTRP